jgi:predicted enzyme related to lactoylglutathione lyase
MLRAEAHQRAPGGVRMLGTGPVMATIPAEDMARAKTFYTDIVGLTVAAEPDAGSAILEAGNGTQIFVYARGRSTAEHTALTFPVADLDAAVDALVAKGVTFEQYDMDPLKTDAKGIARSDAGSAAWLTDTENNIICLVEM